MPKQLNQRIVAGSYGIKILNHQNGHYSNFMVPKHEIVLALAGDDRAALGSIWRITAKPNDFYLDLMGKDDGGIHLSVHGPNERFTSPRFHIKADRRKVQQARGRGGFLDKTLQKPKGVEVQGVQVAEHAYLVARVRWTWELQRPRYRHAALTRVPLPKIKDSREGRVMEARIGLNYAWDVDLVISYHEPYWRTDSSWSKQKQVGPHSPKIGPIKNDAGMYLTGTSVHRSLATDPGPTEHLLLPRPINNEDAQAITTGGFGEGGLKNMYWFE